MSEVCATVATGTMVEGLGTMFILMEQAESYAQRAYELSKQLVELSIELSKKSKHEVDKFAFLKLQELQSRCSVAHDTTDALVDELAKGMAVLEKRFKDPADTELFDVIAQRILNWRIDEFATHTLRSRF